MTAFFLLFCKISLILLHQHVSAAAIGALRMTPSSLFGCSDCVREDVKYESVSEVENVAFEALKLGQQAYENAPDAKSALKILRVSIRKLSTLVHSRGLCHVFPPTKVFSCFPLILQVHPHHTHLQSMQTPLLNCLGATGDFLGKLEVAEQALQHAQNTYPPNMVKAINI